MQNQINEEQNTTTNNETIEGTVFKEKESRVGPIIGSLIIIVIILVGGIYFWSQQIENQKIENEEAAEVTTEDDMVQIENDLEDLNFENIDAELEALDQEFEI